MALPSGREKGSPGWSPKGSFFRNNIFAREREFIGHPRRPVVRKRGVRGGRILWRMERVTPSGDMKIGDYEKKQIITVIANN
jgi:hypothetical protein